MSQYVALIAGITGAIGSALARELGQRSDWKVLGVSRHQPATPVDAVEYISMDMNQRKQGAEILSRHNDISHVFYCGRATHGEQLLESAEDNLRLLDNLLFAVESSGSPLKHVHLVQGGKYYGVHVGPFPSPAREEDSRAPIPNFNYEQQDYLVDRAANSSWSWSASRPNTLVHFSPDIGRNLVSSLGVYAAICRELGANLDFPGPEGAYTSLTQLTSIDLLARAIAWMSVEPKCSNQAFNVTNTDSFRWSSLWPQIAETYGMKCGSVRPLNLVNAMSDRDDFWQQIGKKHQLRQTALSEVVNWGYLDASLERYWDELFSHTKCRKFGFHEWDDSESRLLSLTRQYQKADILPK
ncbi:MAG: nucleoside-diphosphate-sugar epimerase [Parasphingorhabdus sp.]|jgi:nucleoside-diphosphate-sugar epimerase